MRKLYLGLLMILSLGAAVFACACGEEGKVDPNTCQHTYSEWQYVSGKEATCTTGGQQERTCSKCGNKDVRDVDALGHTYSKEKTTVRQSTCKEHGVVGYKCIRCDDVKDGEELELAEHTYGEYTIETPATCTKAGKKTRVCTVCNYKDKATIKAPGHNFDDPNPTTVAAKCEKDGAIIKHCQNEGCEETESRMIRKTGHTWVDEEGTLDPPDCYNDGHVKQVCSVCGKDQIETLTSPGHQYKRTIIEQNTCTKGGKAIDKCSVCGFSKEVELKPTDHNFETIYRVDKMPTETTKGSQSQHCVNDGCDEIRNSQELTMDSKLRYYVKVSRDNGAPVSGSFAIDFLDSTGKVVENKAGNYVYVDLPIGSYTAKIKGLPSGYSVKEDRMELTPQQLDCEFVMNTQINKEDNTLQYYYNTGSVLRNHSLEIIELDEKENYTTTIKDILKKYKAIFINLFYVACNPCMSEIQHMMDAYYTKTPRGTIYGDEVAFIMISNTFYETPDSVRAFKSSPITYSTFVTDDISLPFMMTINDTFLNYLHPEGFPTSYIIDSEGVINNLHLGPIMDTEGFVALFENYALKFYYNSLEKAEAENPVKSEFTAVPEAILPERKH